MTISAACEANKIAGGIICILVGVITLASFLKVQKYAFTRKAEENIKTFKESPLFMRLAMLGLAILCLAVGLFAMPFVDAIIKPAAAVLLEGLNYANLILGA